MKTPPRVIALALALGLGAGAAAQPAPPQATTSEQWHGRLEMKRELTARGSPGESTKTTARVETFFDSPVTLLRLDLPFPDEKTDFQGSPFNPNVGDVKIRLGMRALRAWGYAFPSFVEATFPTADPDEAGTGKYQLSAGIRMLVPLRYPGNDPDAHALLFEAELQQVNSLGGDPARENINYTKLELTLYDRWRGRYTAKLKLKPAYDHVAADHGATGEIEGGFHFGEQLRWRTWLMLGRRLWGPLGLAGTYDDRVELGIARTY